MKPSASAAGAVRGLSVARAWLLGTLLVGTLDIADALLFSWIRRGTPPARVFQAIASGLLGRDAFEAGAAAVALGVLVHYSIACSIAGVYLGASRRLAFLRQRPILWGVIFGLASFGFMQYVVLPLSAVPFGRPQGIALLNGILAHVFCVGIPAALAARAARPSEPPLEPAASAA